MIIETHCVHGNAIVAETVDPGAQGGPLTQVEKIPWTDVIGHRTGWGVIYRGLAGKWVWFHAPVPTPTRVNSVRTQLEDAFIMYNAESGAFLREVHFWDGPDRFQMIGGLRATGDRTRHLETDVNTFVVRHPDGTFHTMAFGLEISILINFTVESNVTFTS